MSLLIVNNDVNNYVYSFMGSFPDTALNQIPASCMTGARPGIGAAPVIAPPGPGHVCPAMAVTATTRS